MDSYYKKPLNKNHMEALSPYAVLLGSALGPQTDVGQDRDLVSLINRTRERSILVLGKDTGSEFQRLQNIADHLKTLGYNPILVKTYADIPELSNEEKVRVFADHSRFVILENSFAAGQIAEIKMCATNRIITATLRERGCGSSYMVTDYFRDFDFIREFEYIDLGESLKRSLTSAVAWGEQKLKERARYYNETYPWRKGSLDNRSS